jgi:hypothetical protein
MECDGMMEADDGMEMEGPVEGMSREAVAFMLELGICPGSQCPMAVGICDPRCPALVAWVEDVVGG